MAPTRGRLKGIYPERKKGSKSTSKQKSKKGKSQQQQCQGDADSGGGCTAEEEELRQFDMDMCYGPCIGVTRLRRWERAAAMGLRPPPHLRDLILRQQHHGGGASSPPPKSKSDGRNNGGDVVSQLECLWAGKV
ncbi:unnamed protein product [Miscanthus lutarioriparius]|uniref:DNA polymerase delta subunit 4 n=1 Tax=Miscanthus lutarioriparius TaxID=422564 RepID=A0A811R4F9_9POAL|nr:unnamed protein product [Miscanthus lutarioriparius]